VKAKLPRQSFSHIAAPSTGRGFLQPNDIWPERAQLFSRYFQTMVKIFGIAHAPRKNPTV
jgi:hypothetical protein